MAGLRSLSTRFILAGVAAAALLMPPTVAMGETRSAVPAASSVTWHDLALVNGWVSEAGGGTGTPAYAVSGGVVYLSGSIDQASGTEGVFATLPPAARPKSILYIAIDFGYLVIQRDGEISHEYSNNFSFASLAGVSYPVSGLTWHTLPLLNGWRSANSAWHTADPAYAVSHGVVYLSGSALQATGTDATLAVLPKIARPTHWLYITVYTYTGTSGFLVIKPDGSVSAYTNTSEPQPYAQQFTSLAAVSYPASGTTWHKLHMINGWKSADSLYQTGDPAYAVIQGIVYLSGSAYRATGSNYCHLAVLPPAARPKTS
jgi:hypothetical protein